MSLINEGNVNRKFDISNFRTSIKRISLGAEFVDLSVITKRNILSADRKMSVDVIR